MIIKAKSTIIACSFLFIVLSAFVPSAFANNFSETEHQKGIRKLQDSANNVLLTVDVSQDKKKISKYFYGVNIANGWLYWTNDYSPYCPVTKANAEPKTDDPGWKSMSDIENQWNRDVFPYRGDDPEITGWETDENRMLSQYLFRAKEYEEKKGMRVADYMDVHRYIRATTEKDAIQETRGLLEDGYISRDLEVSWELGSSSTQIETKILKRFQNMVDMYYPATKLSFSETDL